MTLVISEGDLSHRPIPPPLSLPSPEVSHREQVIGEPRVGFHLPYRSLPAGCSVRSIVGVLR